MESRGQGHSLAEGRRASPSGHPPACGASTKRPIWRSLRLALATALLLWTWAALATSYVYDANNRLVVATNDAGHSARYVYDSMGNLAQVQRLTPNDLAIFSFTPGRGAPGAPVKIKGQGFSPNAGQNLVAFNGVSATVSAATANELSTSVPAGATTGPVTVTVAAASTSSVDAFMVDANARGPVISAVSPLVTTVGSTIITDGQHLAPVPGQTTARLGGRSVQLNALTDTQLQFPVPSTAGSGKVSVATAYGVATSADDVVIVPGGLSASQVSQVRRMSADAGAQNFSIASEGQYAAVLFDGIGGEYLSAQFSAISVSAINYTLYGVDNKKLATGTVSTASPTWHLPKLKESGTYLLVLRPTAAATWTLAIERAASLAADAAPLSIDTTVAAQGKRLIFNAADGANLGLGLSDHTTPTTWANASFYVYGPDGAQVGYQYCDQAKNGCAVNLPALRAGVHSIVIAPAQSGAQKLGFKATLSTDAVARLSRDVSSALSIGRRGQNARWSFAGTAGEVIGLRVAGQQTFPSGRVVYYRIHTPDGALWKSTTATAGLTMNLALPTTGDYQVFVDPEYGETLSANVILSNGSGLALNGADTSFQTTLPGQGVYLTVEASAGQNFGLGIANLVVNDAGAIVVNAYKPDGSLLTNTSCHPGNGGCDLNLSGLQAGKVGIEIVPSADSQTMSFDAALSSDITATLQRDVASTLSIARRGQNARLSFLGVVGDTIALKIVGQSTTPASSGAYYRVYKPDGSSIAAAYANGDKTLNVELPITGDYQIFVDPEFGATLATELKVVAGTVGMMELDGSSGKYETTAGQDVSLTFQASAGKGLGVGISDLVVSSSDRVYVSLYAPSGNQVGSTNWCYVADGGCDMDVYNPVSGNYTVKVVPASATQTMKFRATLSSDVALTLSRDTPVNLSLDRRGGNALLQFAGTAGETVALQVSGQATAPFGKTVLYGVYRPNDRVFDWRTITATAGGAVNLTLPQTGIYWVYVDPQHGASATAQVTLSTGTISSLTLDGASASVEATQVGQGAHFRFNAIAGQGLGFGLSELAVTTSDRVYVSLFAPNGSQVGSTNWCYVADGGCDMDIYNPVAGSYSVVVEPANDTQLMRFKATLSSDRTLTLQRDTPTTLTLDRRGRNGLLTFSGTAGETVALLMSGQATTPAAKTVWYGVYRPNDRVFDWKAVTATTGGAANLSLTQTGTYWVYVDPQHGATATSQVTLSTGTTSGMVADGASASIETGQPGQTAHFRFSATAGQGLGFGLSDLVVSSGDHVYVSLFAPNGSPVGSVNWCYVEDGGCDIDIYNPVAGTYSVVVEPSNIDQAMQFKATLSSDRAVTLQRDTPTTLTLDRRGRNGLLTFSGTAGETVALLISGQATTPAAKTVWYGVYRPNDRVYDWKAVTATTGGAANLSLTQTGTYWVYVDPQHGATATSQVTLSTGTTSGMVADGASANIDTTQLGQTAHFRFSATAGQGLGFGLSDLVVSNGDHVYVSLFAPNGSPVGSVNWCYVGDGGCDIDIYNPVAGTYSVVVEPSSASQLMRFNATLSSDVAATLQRDTPLNVQLDRRGRNALLSFSGTSGETLALQVTEQTSTPVGNTVAYLVYRPNDRVYTWRDVSPVSAGTVTLALPQTGTYWVFMDPKHGARASAKVTLDSTP